jgi:hypothetical protein
MPSRETSSLGKHLFWIIPTGVFLLGLVAILGLKVLSQRDGQAAGPALMPVVMVERKPEAPKESPAAAALPEPEPTPEVRAPEPPPEEQAPRKQEPAAPAVKKGGVRERDYSIGANEGYLVYFDLHVGESGPFPEPTFNFHFEVQRILSASDMVLQTPAGKYKPFILRGLPTAGKADGERVDLTGLWEVTGTKTVLGTTYFVVEKESDEARAGREEQEQQRAAAKPKSSQQPRRGGRNLPQRPRE